jgi:hypothetical protein
MKQNNDSGSTATMNRPQNLRGQQPGQTANKEEMMKKAEAAGKPGPGHKALEHFVGDWKAEVKCWMDPGAEPNVSKATAKGTWILNGRFLQEDFKGEMMGQPFNGRNIIGYDNFRHVFSSVWISDMQTSMFKSEGRGEDGNQTIKLEGTSSCPATERMDIPMRVVLRVLGPDRHTFEMYDCSQGQNLKTMEITYTRA